MNQKHDFKSVKSKRGISFFTSGILSMVICLGVQLASANATTTNYKIVLDETLQSTVTGTVTDETGTPLPGANVVEKGTTNGTQTDFDGNFTLNVESGQLWYSATLVFKDRK
ncbi:carboxypeptidase-like regulatory domain-containing protein [Maribacter litopenaei]|uniref:Carboxypeptidase-like regulatory domain-containing protein n=1 Tax=Maribacter litopenaei TaxID=2976127 RepID=A0ABY5YAI7_9FLAO|nr:carboxypeptidase-like regulatory domain-containing protein [Maribacter litopenaei]UWX56051.1 carboxypeptidase-like regulatory domain-containing protein [Maribacter litopenaei]